MFDLSLLLKDYTIIIIWGKGCVEGAEMGEQKGKHRAESLHLQNKVMENNIKNTKNAIMCYNS